jgi:hypothetical protein
VLLIQGLCEVPVEVLILKGFAVPGLLLIAVGEVAAGEEVGQLVAEFLGGELQAEGELPGTAGRARAELDLLFSGEAAE